ncbi:MAG: oligomeric, coiled-coil, peripheral membrane protein [Claussenomyces sp. TS43310]|nr:MAG: oligomeric, coiled-coil, peripheral membrane protein [Claussenomyces sp. TS43310]
MALQVFIAHTGQRLQAQPGSFANIEAFKSWVAKHGSVPSQNQITLTGQGKAVRAQTLLTEASPRGSQRCVTANTAQQDIFVYDRQIVTSPVTKSKAAISKVPEPPKYEIQSVPDTISDQNDLEAWRDLFMARRTWALKLVDDCTVMSDSTQMRYGEIDVITRSIWAAVNNLQAHVQGLDIKYAEAQNWTAELSKDHQNLVVHCEDSLARLRSIPTATKMVRFMVGHDPRTGIQKACLEDLIDVDEVKSSSIVAEKALNTFTRGINDLGQIMDRVVSGGDNVMERADKSAARSALERSGESRQLMQDIEAIARKVSNDYETVLNYQNNSKSVSQASKSALLHTKNFLPNLSKRCLEMVAILEHATEIRNAAAVEHVEVMQAIGALNTMCNEIVSRLDTFGMMEEDHKAFATLQLVNKLPVIYASFTAEAIRRREWNEKIRNDSSTLANEMATFQDEEERRRKKWQRSTGSLFGLDRAEHKVVGLEVNLLGEEEQWPQASRQELQDYLEAVRAQGLGEEIVTGISNIIADLNNPTKQQSKRAKAFKAGSFHEAALGRSTLLVRGDDDIIRALQDEKSKIEGKLRGSESRVRRLEDLLHRQSHLSRTSTGNVFHNPNNVSPSAQELSNPMASPRPADDLSRRSSVSSRRFSANQGPEEKAFAQRLINLEAELIAERERTAGLERELSARASTTNDIKGQWEEANSTKQDLLKNLEAQQGEFGAERKSLESEIKELRSRLEAYEDDIDRIIGSRENEKVNIDERVRALHDELDRLRVEKTAEAQKTQGQVDFLRNDAKLQRESNESLSRELQRAKEDTKDFRIRAERAEHANDEYLEALNKLHTLLFPNVSDPTDVSELMEGLFSKSRDIVAELDVHKHDIVIARSDLEAAQVLLSDTKTDLTDMVDKLKTEEMETFQLRENMAVKNAKFHSVEAELADERKELTHLRAKFAAGETGSEALRSRVEEEEGKVSKLSEELAGRRSEVGSLEEELRSLQDRNRSVQTHSEDLSSRLESRTMRAKDLTQRLYAQNDRLCRLLERMSYSIVRDGDSMIIQRIPKTERTSATDSSDPGSSMRRSVSGSVPRKAMADSGDLELLYWMQTEDPEAESEKYDAYLKAVGSFDVEAFCETIMKRLKDLEQTARKYTKDARAYRERYRRYEKEAHEKIAYKNFKDGDLALFLPTKNQTTGAWAAFNVGAPHYFLHEQDSHKLRSRDWLLARISKIEERVVDLSKSMTAQQSTTGDRGSIGEASNGGDSFEDDNPFDLSDGLRWYLIEAAEEKPGAPSTPGLGKSTVATTSVDATGSIRRSKKSYTTGINDDISKTLSRSLDSRRSSSNSKKAGSFLNSTSKTPVSISDAGKAPLQSGESSTEAALRASSSKPDMLGRTSTPPPQLLSAGSNVENIVSTGTSPGKKSMIWDSLWSLDLSLESGNAGKR